MPDHEVVLLAALIADGNLTERTPRFCSGEGLARSCRSSSRPPRLRLRLHDGGGGTTTHQRRPRRPVRTRSPSSARAPRPVGPALGGRSSSPTRSSALGDEQIAASSRVLYACDGHVYCGERYAQIGYTTISERLAHDVQHLLLRLGIVADDPPLKRACLRGHRNGRARGADHRPRRARGVRAARRRWSARTTALERVLAARRRAARSTPTSTRSRSRSGTHVLRGQGRALLGRRQRRAGRPRNHNWHVGTRGLSRPQLADARRGDAQRRARGAGDVRPVVGRGRLDRGPRRAGDLRPRPSPASTTSSPTTSSSTTAR